MRIVSFVFFPFQEILLPRAYRAVLQSLGIVTCKDKLHRRKERRNKFSLLVHQALANAIANRHPAVFQLQHAQRNAVHIHHHVWAFVMLAQNRYFFSHCKVIAGGLFPVDQLHRGEIFTRFGLHRYAIAQHLIHRMVVVIQIAVWVVRSLMQLIHGFRYQRCAVTCTF